MAHPSMLNMNWICENRSVVSDSLWPHGLRSFRLLCSWYSPGNITGVDSHPLFHRIFWTQGLNPGLPLCRWILDRLNHQGSPWTEYAMWKRKTVHHVDIRCIPYNKEIKKIGCRGGDQRAQLKGGLTSSTVAEVCWLMTRTSKGSDSFSCLVFIITMPLMFL